MDIATNLGLAILIGVGCLWVLRRAALANDSQTYFLSEKRTPLFALIATLVMTELNTSTLVGFASMGYIFGPSASLLACVFLVGLMFYALTVAKKWKQFDGVSVTTFFHERYGPLIGYIVALILVTTMLGFSANFLKSVTLIFAPLFPDLGSWTLSGIFCVLMMLITLRGGLSTIIRIDILSFVITLILLPTFLWFSCAHIEGAVFAEPQGAGFPVDMVFSLSIITMFTYILAPWYGQKIFSAASESIAFKAVVCSSILVTGLYILAILAAHCVALDGQATLQNPQEAIPYAINHFLPPVLQGLLYGILFLIAATTLAGLWNTISSVILSHHSKSVADKSLSVSIAFTAFIAFSAFLGANLFVDQILEKLILCNIPIAALAFSLLGGFYWKAVTPLASLVSIITGVVGGVACYLYFGDPHYIWYWAIYVVPLHFLVGVGVTWLSPLFSSRLKVQETSG